jgi:hypothetical protein
LNAVISIPDESAEDFAGNWLAYNFYAERKDTNTAGLHLERCLKLSRFLTEDIRELSVQEATIFTAWFRDDALLAEKWLGQLRRPGLIQPLQRIRMEVALSSGRHDLDASLRAWEQGFRYIEKLPPRPLRDSLKRSWLEWRSEIEDRRGAATSA